jgi:purine-binding chemotaxis protein CheW
MNDTVVAPNRAAGQSVEQYLTFLLAGQEYGIEILRVQEIKGWDKPTRIPHSPEHVLGVINLRGAVVPIVDLRMRFGVEQAPFGPTTVVIVVRVHGERGELTAGIVVDAVCEVCNVTAEELRPPPEVGGAIDSDFIKGLAMTDKRMLILLSVDRLISASLFDQIEQKVA